MAKRQSAQVEGGKAIVGANGHGGNPPLVPLHNSGLRDNRPGMNQLYQKGISHENWSAARKHTFS